MTLDRRQFIRLVTVAAGTFSTTLPALAGGPEDVEDQPHVIRGRRLRVGRGRQFFPQSVASFEPRPTSVIVWARVSDPARPGQLPAVTLIASTDPALRQRVLAVDLQPQADDDGVVQVKLTGLPPRTRIYYRFVVAQDGALVGSAIGRAQTAPLATDARPVRFVFASCQDAVGRYYNTYLRALGENPDFVAHLGDYIYETTGDPSFQSTTGRRFTLTDTAGAIPLRAADGSTYFAAASISNYRDIWRFYRSDRVLQRLHERFTFVQIWDDHEYSDDCWGATATFFDGRRDEFARERRRHAERVFHEYVPVDVDGALPSGEVDVGRTPLWPEVRIHRDFRYGAHLHLFLTDYRSFRPDHLIPEDAFPGTVPVDRASLTALLPGGEATYQAVKGGFAPYVDLDAPPSAALAAVYAGWKQVLAGGLTAAYVGEGLAPAAAAAFAASKAVGKVDIRVLNPFIVGYNATPAGQAQPLPLAEDNNLDRGISFLILGKQTLFGSFGSRYFVVKATYDLYAAYLTFIRRLPAEQAYGAAQLAWLQSGVRASDATWKVVANSTSFTSMVLDLTGTLPGLPPEVAALFAALPATLRQRFYLNVDQMDGFPNFRRQLLDLYAGAGNVALIAGDIHASFVTRHGPRTWEFTGPGVSSFAFGTGVAGAVAADPALASIPGLPALVAQLDTLLRLANPQIGYVNTAVNGIVSVEIGAQRLVATYHQLDGAEAVRSAYDRPATLANRWITHRVEVPADGA
jgi:alkaline phosphatase D